MGDTAEPSCLILGTEDGNRVYSQYPLAANCAHCHRSKKLVRAMTTAEYLAKGINPANRLVQLSIGHEKTGWFTAGKRSTTKWKIVSDNNSVDNIELSPGQVNETYSLGLQECNQTEESTRNFARLFKDNTTLLLLLNSIKWEISASEYSQESHAHAALENMTPEEEARIIKMESEILEGQPLHIRELAPSAALILRLGIFKSSDAVESDRGDGISVHNRTIAMLLTMQDYILASIIVLILMVLKLHIILPWQIVKSIFYLTIGFPETIENDNRQWTISPQDTSENIKQRPRNFLHRSRAGPPPAIDDNPGPSTFDDVCCFCMAEIEGEIVIQENCRHTSCYDCFMEHLR